MSLEEVKEVCKELGLFCKPVPGCELMWHVYTTNYSKWIASYYLLFSNATIFNLDVPEPLISDKDEFKKGLLRKLKEIKEESIKDRIRTLENDFV